MYVVWTYINDGADFNLLKGKNDYLFCILITTYIDVSVCTEKLEKKLQA